MNISEKLTAVAENVPKVFEAGKKAAKIETGVFLSNLSTPCFSVSGLSFGPKKVVIYNVDSTMLITEMEEGIDAYWSCICMDFTTTLRRGLANVMRRNGDGAEFGAVQFGPKYAGVVLKEDGFDVDTSAAKYFFAKDIPYNWFAIG